MVENGGEEFVLVEKDEGLKAVGGDVGCWLSGRGSGGKDVPE